MFVLGDSDILGINQSIRNGLPFPEAINVNGKGERDGSQYANNSSQYVMHL
jgi:hypothetical protein